MLVSHSRRFIYVKLLKVASTSMQMALAKVCGPQDIVTPVAQAYMDFEPRNCFREGRTSAEHPCDHANLQYSADMTAPVIRSLLPNEWEEYFTFCVVRNPWDKALSLYAHNIFAGTTGALVTPSMAILSGKMRLSQWDWYADDNGPIVDHTILYEEMDDGLAVLGERLGLPGPLQMPQRARSEYRTDRRHYREVLSPEAADHIAKVCAREIEYHGYEY